MRYHKIPDETVRQMPIYLRELLFLSEQGQKNTSSRDLADALVKAGIKGILNFSPCYIIVSERVKSYND